MAEHLNSEQIQEQLQAIDSLDIEELRKFARKVADAYFHEKDRKIALDEECDLLAWEIERLKGEVHRLEQSNIKTHVSSAASAAAAAGPASAVTAAEIFFREGDGKYPSTLAKTFSDACGGKNVIATAFCDTSKLPSVPGLDSYDLLLCGGVDAMLYGYIYQSNGSHDSAAGTGDRTLFQIAMNSPILSIDTCGPLVACSAMDGSHMIVSNLVYYLYYYYYYYY